MKINLLGEMGDDGYTHLSDDDDEFSFVSLRAQKNCSRMEIRMNCFGS